MKKKIAISFLAMSVLAIPTPGNANGFDPGNLISDERFADTATLGGAEGIQKFLEIKGSVLANTSLEFLSKLREPSDAGLKSRLPDPRPSLGRLRSAAELIYDAATSAGVNPQVVLVTLHKEQSLITGKYISEKSLQRAMDHALGFGCPDEGGCQDIFLGFYYQLFGNFDSAGNRYIGMPASLARSFNFEVGGVRVGRGPMVDAANCACGNSNRIRIARKGDVITLENTQGPPNNAPASQVVTLSNFATTALYRYTPHVFNGNYNFWKFFTEWFKYPDGTLVQTSGDAKIYVIDNGLRRQISNFVITQRGLAPAAVISISSVEFAEFSQGDVMVPNEGTILKNSQGQAFLIEQGTSKSLSTFVAAQRKLNLAGAAVVPDDEIASYPAGGRALPAEGTLVKSKDSPAVYIIASNEKRLLSAFVFKQRGYKFANILTAEPGELDSYPTGTMMPPLDGTLVKATEEPAVYYVGNGILSPVSYFVFTNSGFKFKDVMSVPKAELSTWSISAKPLPPPSGLLVKGKNSPAVYYLESGVRRPVSYAVFVSSRYEFKNVITISDEEIGALELGDDLALPERALVKTSDAPTVYYLVDGVLRPLTFPAFQNRRLRFQDVVTVSPEEFAKYQVGAVVEN